MPIPETMDVMRFMLDKVDNRDPRRKYGTYQARHGESLPVFMAGALQHHHVYRTRYMGSV